MKPFQLPGKFFLAGCLVHLLGNDKITSKILEGRELMSEFQAVFYADVRHSATFIFSVSFV